MAEEWVKCRREGCDVVFKKKVHNQSFHSKECTRIYTNERILAQYHAKKNQPTKDRICAHKGCGTVLSRYNDDIFCGPCQTRRQKNKIRDWGWEISDD